MLNRRNFLMSTALASLGAPALAQYSSAPGYAPSPTGVVVLELINFFCARCNAVNDQHSRLSRVAKENGLDFRVAPVASEGQSIWPDRFYYAIRDLYPELTDRVRNAFFRGIHREGMIFEDKPQVLSYLETTGILAEGVQIYNSFSVDELVDRAESDVPLISGAKAVSLIEQSGAEEFPIFLWIHNGEIIQGITTYNANEPLRLTMLVVHAMKQPLSAIK